MDRNERKAIRIPLAIKKSLIFTVVTLGLLDVLCSFTNPEYLRHETLVFPPNESLAFQTLDHEFVVRTNSIGIRSNREWKPKSTQCKRIMVLGNSYTYGWGVNYEDSWPARLEARLKASGQCVEVANLARPGPTTEQVLDYAERGSKLLKPDVTLVAILEGPGAVFDGSKQRVAIGPETLKAVLSYFQPNVMRAINYYYRLVSNGLRDPLKPQTRSSNEARDEWIKQFAVFEKSLSAKDQERFRSLSPKVIELFRTGRLHPNLMGNFANPETHFYFTDQNNPGTLLKKKETHEGLVNLKAIAAQNGSQFLVVLLPYPLYEHGLAAQQMAEMGYRIPESGHGDAGWIVSSAAKELNIPLIDVRADFRASSTDDLYLPYDGHYNAKGYDRVASSVVKFMTDKGR